MNYVIAWQSSLTGAEGRGTTAFPKEVAEDAVRELNKEWPDLRHWAEPECPFISALDRLAS